MLKFFSAAPRLFASVCAAESLAAANARTRERRARALPNRQTHAGRFARQSRIPRISAVRGSWRGVREIFGGLPKPPNSGNVAVRATTQRSDLRYTGSNVTERRCRGCYGTGPAFQLGAQSERVLDDVVAAAVFWTDPAAWGAHDRSAPACLGAARRVEQGSLPDEGLRLAVLDPACRASEQRDSPGLLFEPARPPVQLHPRRVEAFADQDRPGRHGRTPRSVLHRLPRGDGRTEAAIPAGEIRLAAVRRRHRHFLSSPGGEVGFRFLDGAPLRAVAPGPARLLQGARPALRPFQGRGIDHRGAGTSDVERAIFCRDPAGSRQPPADGRVQSAGDAIFRGARRRNTPARGPAPERRIRIDPAQRRVLRGGAGRF